MNNQNYSNKNQFQSVPSVVQQRGHIPHQAQSPISISNPTQLNAVSNQSQEEPFIPALPSQQTNLGNSWMQQGQANLPSTNLQNASIRSRVKRRKMDRKALILASVCLFLLVGVVSYALYQFVFKGTPNVTLYRVSMKSVNEDIGGGGIAYPVEQLNISYPFTANVLAVFVQPGDKVTPKQPLMQLDLSQVNAQYITQLNAEVAQAYQNMLAAKAYLYSVSVTGNSVEIARAQQQYASAQASYNALQEEISASSSQQGKITSSINGTVTAVNVYQGQSIAANHVLLTIFDESSIIFRTSMPLSNYGHVHLNQPAQVIPSGMPDQTFNGKVISIIPNANTQSGTFEVRVMVDNTGGELLPGMSAFVHIPNPVQALAVPRLAVLNPDLDSNVFVVRQQHVYIQHVQILGYEGDTYIIGSGLHVNDLIVLVGLSTLRNGQVVHITGIES
ncbi:MAG: efflux RND transporter periplasmic adaptor subunit [Ktedonobacteraceae bacterium]